MNSRMQPVVRILGLLCVLLLLILLSSELRLRKSFPSTVASDDPRIPGGDSTHGRTLALAACASCHGADLAGREIADVAWLGRLYASNLTPGHGGIPKGQLASMVLRAIRDGVDADGHTLVLMPSVFLRRISDTDLADLIAYLAQIEPVDRDWPERRLGLFTRAVLGLGLADELLAAETVAASVAATPAPVPGASESYGGYLVDLGGCRVCHHSDLRGGRHLLAVPGEPEPPSLQPHALRHWSLKDFVSAMRAGQTPDGRRLNAEYMPWPFLGQLEDYQLEALWLYLRSDSAEPEVS